MKEPLFNTKNEVTKEDVLNRLDYYIELANQGRELYEIDKRTALEMGNKIRQKLRVEYKNNDLISVGNYYREHKFFRKYKKAIHSALVTETGVFSYEKLGWFLSGVLSYLEGCKISLEN